jgi:hypothetical protein
MDPCWSGVQHGADGRASSSEPDLAVRGADSAVDPESQRVQVQSPWAAPCRPATLSLRTGGATPTGACG